MTELTEYRAGLTVIKDLVASQKQTSIAVTRATAQLYSEIIQEMAGPVEKARIIIEELDPATNGVSSLRSLLSFLDNGFLRDVTSLVAAAQQSFEAEQAALDEQTEVIEGEATEAETDETDQTDETDETDEGN